MFSFPVNQFWHRWNFLANIVSSEYQKSTLLQLRRLSCCKPIYSWLLTCESGLNLRGNSSPKSNGKLMSLLWQYLVMAGEEGDSAALWQGRRRRRRRGDRMGSVLRMEFRTGAPLSLPPSEHPITRPLIRSNWPQPPDYWNTGLLEILPFSPFFKWNSKLNWEHQRPKGQKPDN